MTIVESVLKNIINESSISEKDADKIVRQEVKRFFDKLSQQDKGSPLNIPKNAFDEAVRWTFKRFDLVSIDFPIDYEDLKEQVYYSCVDVIWEGLSKVGSLVRSVRKL